MVNAQKMQFIKYDFFQDLKPIVLLAKVDGTPELMILYSHFNSLNLDAPRIGGFV
jgi:hypothetical protein